MKPKRKSTWLKNRGYLHLSEQINVHQERGEVLGKVKNKDFVAKHAFFPLIHTNIKVRRYKSNGGDKKAHSHNSKPNTKLRPLHYATHIDSMILGYYGEILTEKYLSVLNSTPNLANCITAYRRIADPSNKGSYKSTIHFAQEVFQEIKTRAERNCWVLKFDIEKFFSSMDHRLLKKAWANLLDQHTLPADHYNVFKAATKFSYILKDDLRTKKTDSKRRTGFDEKLFADIRKHGVSSHFLDASSFREKIKAGQIKVYKNAFKNAKGETIGIPQGLPISATLANLYLLEFDKLMLNEVCEIHDGFYRRYSDDIIVICSETNKDHILKFVSETLTNGSKVSLSHEKTEQHFFENNTLPNGTKALRCNILRGKLIAGQPLTYLGFEYYGDKILIKSSNLSKFYRRMIFAVKSRSKRATLAAAKCPLNTKNLFKRRLYRLYTNINLDETKTTRRLKYFSPNRFGYYVYKTEPKEDDFKSNYFTYARRASRIMDSEAIIKQLRRHRTIFNQAIVKHHLSKL